MKNILDGVDQSKVKLFNFSIEDSEKLREERSIVHYITTDTKDWGGDVIVQEGINTERYEKYRTVFFNHNYDKVIARNLWLKRNDKGWLAKTQFSKSNVFADDIYNLYLEDMIRTWSVGIMVDKTKYDEEKDTLFITQSQLFEYSSAPLAANFDAIDQAKSLMKSIEGQMLVDNLGNTFEIKKAFEDFRKEIDEIKCLNTQLNELIDKSKEEIGTFDKQILLLTSEITELKNNTAVKSTEIIGKPDFSLLAKEILSGVISEYKGRN
jgi:hypothetical protein